MIVFFSYLCSLLFFFFFATSDKFLLGHHRNKFFLVIFRIAPLHPPKTILFYKYNKRTTIAYYAVCREENFYLNIFVREKSYLFIIKLLPNEPKLKMAKLSKIFRQLT